MNEEGRERESNVGDTAQHPRVELSPDEQLAEPPTAAPLVPGAQSAESEVKKEFNPNTE